MSERKEHHHGKRRYFIPGILAAITIITAGLSAGFWLSNTLFQFIGRPSDFGAYIMSALIGFFLLMLFSRIYFWIIGKTGKDHRHMIADSLEALNRISRGDFSVTLAVNEHDPFTELNKSINDMAKNLGNLETMRQDFISNVSHEIQSPLTSIGGFAALLKKDGLPDYERRRYADIIETESKRLSALSDNLLKLSTLDNRPLAKTEYRLDKQLANVILTLEPQWIEKHLTVEADLQKCVIRGDEDLLSQAWVNLLHNAIKFTPDNGTIYISLNENTLKIADTGLGIPQDDLPHIFERFYKADKARDRSLGGNGLGLSLVKKIVELHGGHITVESELAKGSEFSVFLPKEN